MLPVWHYYYFLFLLWFWYCIVMINTIFFVMYLVFLIHFRKIMVYFSPFCYLNLCGLWTWWQPPPPLFFAPLLFFSLLFSPFPFTWTSGCCLYCCTGIVWLSVLAPWGDPAGDADPYYYMWACVGGWWPEPVVFNALLNLSGVSDACSGPPRGLNHWWSSVRHAHHDAPVASPCDAASLRVTRASQMRSRGRADGGFPHDTRRTSPPTYVRHTAHTQVGLFSLTESSIREAHQLTGSVWALCEKASCPFLRL